MSNSKIFFSQVLFQFRRHLEFESRESMGTRLYGCVSISPQFEQRSTCSSLQSNSALFVSGTSPRRNVIVHETWYFHGNHILTGILKIRNFRAVTFIFLDHFRINHFWVSFGGFMTSWKIKKWWQIQDGGCYMHHLMLRTPKERFFERTTRQVPFNTLEAGCLGVTEGAHGNDWIAT